MLVVAVGSSNPAANQAVADLAERLAVGRTAPVRAAFGTCDPRPEAVIADLPEPIAIAPLFLADGLLLDPVRSARRRARLDHDRSHWAGEPPRIVLDRYRCVVGKF